MTPIPCFSNSCSNDLTFDPVTGLSVEARLAATGSIECDTEASPNGGLFVQVAGLVEDATSPVTLAQANAMCQSLGRTTTGDLFAYPEGAFGLSQSEIGLINGGNGGGNPVHVDTEGGSGGAGTSGPANAFKTFPAGSLPQFSATKQITNPFGCPCYVQYVVQEAKVMAIRPSDLAGPESYYFKGFAGLAVTGANQAMNSGAFKRFDRYGSWSGGAGAEDDLQDAFSLSTFFRLAAGQTATITHTMQVSHSYHVNMDTPDPTDSKGLVMLHPVALLWRQDQHPAVVDG